MNGTEDKVGSTAVDEIRRLTDRLRAADELIEKLSRMALASNLEQEGEPHDCHANPVVDDAVLLVPGIKAADLWQSWTDSSQSVFAVFVKEAYPNGVVIEP
jgi:hypothetical protein